MSIINDALKKTQENLEQKTPSDNKDVSAIYDISKGTPRMINILCDRALLAGFVLETYTITKEIIYNCAREVVHT